MNYFLTSPKIFCKYYQKYALICFVNRLFPDIVIVHWSLNKRKFISGHFSTWLSKISSILKDFFFRKVYIELFWNVFFFFHFFHLIKYFSSKNMTRFFNLRTKVDMLNSVLNIFQYFQMQPKVRSVRSVWLKSRSLP